MALSNDRGQRSIANLIDSYAIEEPHRAWASIPVDDNDLAKGFRDVSFEEFANAINHAAHWLQENVAGMGTGTFETLAYAGPRDLRYPILAVAAVKCGKQLLLLSHFAGPDIQTHLLRLTNCTTYLHAATAEPLLRSIREANANVRLLEIPERHEWLFRKERRLFPYHRTWEEAKSDPWLIFHTSGTTGLLTPVVYTNWMMTSFDAAELMPDTDQETVNDQFRNSRCYTPLPSLHLVGMTAALQWPVFLNTVLVVGPPDVVGAAEAIQVLELGNADGAAMPPSLIQDILRDPRGLDQLRKLDYLCFAGAPLPRSVAELLVGYTKVFPDMGSTEAGSYFIKIRNEDDWDYYCFRSGMGVEFEPRAGQLYELVFRRKPSLERWQQVFHLYPTLDEYPTKDLWARHPSRPDLWRWAGRADDLIILSNGYNLWPADIEVEIQKHPDVRSALIGGQRRHRPFLIVELFGNTLTSQRDRDSKLDDVWPYVERANDRFSDDLKLTRSLAIFTDPAKPLLRTAKGTVSRQASLELYSTETDRQYVTLEHRSASLKDLS